MSITSISSRRSVTRRVRQFAIPVLIGLAAFGWSRWSYLLHAVADVPSSIDIGRQDNNKLVLSDVTIHNAGLRPLELSKFRVSCPSCITFGLPSNEGLVDVDQLTIAPRESITLSARLMVHGTPEQPFRAAIFCETNDPRRRELSVMFEAAVNGWILASPPEVDIGVLKPGEGVRRTVEIRDNGRGESRRFGRLQVPASGQVRVMLTPADDSSGIATRSGAGSDLIGKLEIDITAPATAWELDEKVTLYEADEEGKPLLVVPIRGRVLPRVRVTPASVVLPRVVRDTSSFTAECTISSTTGCALRVTPSNLPEEITATLLERSEDGARYRLDWRAEHLPPKDELRAVKIGFRVELDGHAEVVDVPVRCRRD